MSCFEKANHRTIQLAAEITAYASEHFCGDKERRCCHARQIPDGRSWCEAFLDENAKPRRLNINLDTPCGWGMERLPECISSEKTVKEQRRNKS